VWIDAARGHAYLATKKLVPDLEKQTSRPAEVAGQRQSDCSDDASYEPNLDALSSHAHAPVADFGTMTGRPGSPDSDDESRRLGPGAYENIDPAVAHPSAPAAFFGTGREDDPHASGEPDHEGDMLVLHPEVAAQKVLPSIPATGIHEPVLESDWALREREVVGEDGSTVRIKSIKERLLLKHAMEEFFVPEAGDYHADYSATRPQVKGAVAMEGQEGRKDAEQPPRPVICSGNTRSTTRLSSRQ